LQRNIESFRDIGDVDGSCGVDDVDASLSSSPKPNFIIPMSLPKHRNRGNHCLRRLSLCTIDKAIPSCFEFAICELSFLTAITASRPSTIDSFLAGQSLNHLEEYKDGHSQIESIARSGFQSP
jgi:hypothetical protein